MPSEPAQESMSIEQANDQLEIRIPGAKHTEHRLLLSIQLVALALATPIFCCFAWQSVSSLLENIDASRVAFALACTGGLVLGWPVALISVVYSLLWETRGVEVLTVGDAGITRELAPAPLFRWKRHYPAGSIRGLTVLNRPIGGFSPFRSIDSGSYVFGRLRGRLALEYDRAKVEMGNGLSDDEAQRVMVAVREALQADDVPIAPSELSGPKQIPSESSGRPVVRLASFLIPWSMGMVLALIPLASPYQAPLIALAAQFEPAKESDLVLVLAILLMRLLAGGILGAAIGYLQARGLSNIIANGRGWIVASCASYALGDVANVLVLGRIRELLGSVYSAFDLVISGAPAQPILAPLALLVSFLGISFFFGAPYGAMIAVPQWIYLRKKVLRGWRWLVVYPAAFSVALGLAFAFAWLVGIILFGSSRFGDSVVLGAMQVAALVIWPIPAAILSGAGMAAMVRTPTPKAIEVTGGLGGKAH